MTQSKDSDETFTINLNDYTTDTIDLSNIDGIVTSDSSITISLDDYTVSPTTTWDTSTISDYTFNVSSYNEIFIDTMPSVHTVDDMCKEYPALNKAYETFKSVYKMCEQDYKGKLKAQGLDDDLPF